MFSMKLELLSPLSLAKVVFCCCFFLLISWYDCLQRCRMLGNTCSFPQTQRHKLTQKGPVLEVVKMVHLNPKAQYIPLKYFFLDTAVLNARSKTKNSCTWPKKLYS